MPSLDDSRSAAPPEGVEREIIVICGSRDYADRATLCAVMDGVLFVRVERPPPVIVHGQCPYGGADALADTWAKARGLEVWPCPPEGVGRQYLLARNRTMVDLPADLVCAFSSGLRATAGTGYTCRYAYDRGIPVLFTDSLKRTRHFEVHDA